MFKSVKNIRSVGLNLLWLVLFLFLVLEPSFRVATVFSFISNTIGCEKIDLEISEIVTHSESNFKRLVIIEEVWDTLVLNMTLQNFGDPLDGIILEFEMDEQITHYTYNALETVGLVKALVYQFELKQNLILPLNYTRSGISQVEILVVLDHVASVKKPEINLFISQVELIALNAPNPLKNMILPLFGTNRPFIIHPSNILFLEKKLVIRSFLLSQLPQQMQLNCIISIKLGGIGFNQVQINGYSFIGSDISILQFNLSLVENTGNLGNFIPLNFVIYPNYDQINELTGINVSISISGILKQRSNLGTKFNLGPHPIPWWLMYPLILISLFGIPYYKVYKEHLMEREEEFMDPKRKSKIR